jgi:hypothetical protein
MDPYLRAAKSFPRSKTRLRNDALLADKKKTSLNLVRSGLSHRLGSRTLGQMVGGFSLAMMSGGFH